jgi:hypothetical protein
VHGRPTRSNCFHERLGRMGPGGRGGEEANIDDFDKSDVKGAVEVPKKPFCVSVCVCVR